MIVYSLLAHTLMAHGVIMAQHLEVQTESHCYNTYTYLAIA